MRLKIICIVLVLMLLSSALAMDRDALRAAWQEIADLRTDASPYAREPDPGSFTPGDLTEDARRDALNCLNFLREIAGLDPVALNDLYNLRAQNGALLLAANDFLDHNGPQPAGMDDALYESARMGTSLGNIAKFNWMKPDILVDGVCYFARDDGDTNLPVLGHRRWLLNPRMAETGFGLANAESGMSYVSMYAVDLGNADAAWDYVAWPASGAFPVEMMRSQLAWSVSLNDELYDPGLSHIRIYIIEEKSGAEFFLEPGHDNPDGYCTLSRDAYGSGACLIFRPDLSEKGIGEYLQNQIWTVEISGLADCGGNPKSIRYSCEMVSLYPQEAANVEISQLEATLAIGEPLYLSARVIPDYADDLDVSWSSSDPNVATVSQSGAVLAVGTGECTITAESVNGRSDFCTVRVE